MIYTEKIRVAMEIAEKAHRNQKDKGGYPYIFHSFSVAEQMRDNEDKIIVALLHDVVEDTDISLDYLKQYFENNIIEALSLLSRKKGVSYFDYIKEIKKNPLACSVKIADLRHNIDLSRLENVEPKDVERKAKYKSALDYLNSCVD